MIPSLLSTFFAVGYSSVLFISLNMFTVDDQLCDNIFK